MPLLPYGLYGLYRDSVPVQGCTLLYFVRFHGMVNDYFTCTSMRDVETFFFRVPICGGEIEVRV